jgi:hypothetical protein
MAQFAGGLTPLTGAPQAAQQAHALMYLTVLQQSSYQAFMSVFGWSALLIGALLLTPMLMRKVIVRGGIPMH